MATKSVLGIDARDQIHKLIIQADAILELVGEAGKENNLSDDAVSSACWAVRDMLSEVKRISTGSVV